MNQKQKQFELLSAFIDGELSSNEKAKIEKLVTESKEFQKKLEELKRIKQLTSQIEKLPDSPYLETKIMAELGKGKSDSRKIRKWAPTFALVTVTLFIAVVLKINPNLITDFWEDQKTAITGFYKENLQPVFFAANLNNEDIFNFAFNNELPLNNKRDQYLHLGYDDAGEEYFEIRSASAVERESGYNKFITSLKLNEAEKQLVDSIIGSYAGELESQVLVNDKNTLAINPKLWNYRKAIFADLVTVAQNFNKIEVKKLIPRPVSEDERLRVVNAVQKLKTAPGNQYIFCTPDSVFTDVYEFKKRDIDLKNLRGDLEKEKEKIKQVTVNLRFDSTWKNLKDESKIKRSFRIEVDSNFCRVDISGYDIPLIRIPDFDGINHLIVETTKNFQFHTYNIPKIEQYKEGMKFDYYDGDSIHSFEFRYEELNIDSMLESQLELHESLRFENEKWLKWFDDSALSKYQFDNDYFLRYYDQESMKEQIIKLQEELQRFKEEMKDWEKREEKQTTVKYK